MCSAGSGARARTRQCTVRSRTARLDAIELVYAMLVAGKSIATDVGYAD
jgi:hypothetical protein